MEDESRRVQLIDLASQVEVTGKFQGLVNKIVRSREAISHLNKVGKVSGALMYGVMAKNALADFLNDDYKGVAINLGFIAGGRGLTKIAKAVSTKGVGLITDGKVLLGRSLKAASPFLARSTSAFVVYDLANQIKELESGDKDALIPVIGDSVYLGIDAAEIGIEIAEAFEVLEGVSSVTGPIGATIGTVVFIGTDIYMAVKRVGKIDEIIHLTGGEKFIEGLRAFVGMKPEQYVEELMDRKQANNQLVKQRLEYLKQHNGISRYVFPTGKSVKDNNSCITVTEEGPCTGITFCSPSTVKREKCQEKIQVDLDNVAVFDKEVGNVVYDRAKPDDPDEGKLFCLPNDPIRPESGGEDAYLCHNAIGLHYPANRTGNYTLIALGKGKDRAIGFRNSPNIFLVDNGDKEFTGSNKDDLFILVGNKTTGKLNGDGGNNTLNLAEFSLNENLNIKPDSHKNDSSIFSPSNDIRIKNMNVIHGRKGKQDIIDCDCDVRYIDGQGGKSNNNPDRITIPYCYRSNEKKVIVRPSTEINNLDKSRGGNFDYIILPDKGEANINIEPDYTFTQQRKHNFLFNYTLFDLASVNIENIKDINHWYAGYGNMTHTIRNVTFSFLSPLSKGKSINEKFDITISDIPANASYILSDNTEINVGKNNSYAMHNTNKAIDEIVRSYPTVADHLKMSLFISANNETVVIGHGSHDVINNNFLQKSHLIGSGGENVYVVTSGHEILDIENLPIPEVIVYDNFNKENSLKDTLDLRQLVRQINGDLSIEPISKIIEDRNDLLIKLSISATALKQDVITVRLKDAFVNNWYKELQVILNNAPMKIDDNLDLSPLPLTFDEEIIVVTSQDVEGKGELIISKEAGQLTFLHSGYDLMITNAFNAGVETNKLCTICLKDFYKEPKMETLSIKFTDKEILLSDEMDKINNADSISDKLNINDYISSIVKLQESSAPLEAAINNHPIRHKRHKDHSRQEDDAHHIRHEHHRVQKHNSNYQGNYYYIDQPEIAASSGTRPSSWINDLFSWVKSSVGGLFYSRATLSEEESNIASSIPQVDTQFAKSSGSSNGALDAKKITKHKLEYRKDVPNSTSNTPYNSTDHANGTGQKQGSKHAHNYFTNGGFFRDNVDYVNANLSQARERQMYYDFNGTITLLDLLIRKKAGQKHVSTQVKDISEREALNYAFSITQECKKIVEQAALKSGISMHRLGIDFMGVQREITGKIMGNRFDKIAEIVSSYVEKACPGREAGCPGKLSTKKFGKFMAEFNNELDRALNQSIQQMLYTGPGFDILEGEIYKVAHRVLKEIKACETISLCLPKFISEDDIYTLTLGKMIISGNVQKEQIVDVLFCALENLIEIKLEEDKSEEESNKIKEFMKEYNMHVKTVLDIAAEDIVNYCSSKFGEEEKQYHSKLYTTLDKPYVLSCGNNIRNNVNRIGINKPANKLDDVSITGNISQARNA